MRDELVYNAQVINIVLGILCVIFALLCRRPERSRLRRARSGHQGEILPVAVIVGIAFKVDHPVAFREVGAHQVAGAFEIEFLELLQEVRTIGILFTRVEF